MHWAGTDSPDAFLAFLRGVELYEEFHGPHRDLKILQHANNWFEKVIAADPEFVNPHYYHCDFFLHYLTNTNQNSYRPDTLSYETAFRSLKVDLEQAISKSKLDADKDFFLLLKTMYSDDWSGIRPIVERVLASPEGRFACFRSEHCPYRH